MLYEPENSGCTDSVVKNKEAGISSQPIFSLLSTARYGLLFSALAIFALRAADVRDSLTENASTQFSGYTAIESGQIQKLRYADAGGNLLSEYNRVWVGHAYLNLFMSHTISEHLSVIGSMETRMWYNSVYYNPDQTDGYPVQNFNVYFPNAAGIISFGGRGKPNLNFTIGRFEYKYDDQAQNLGEYLFRAGDYPGYIITNFDVPLARLCGLKASLKFGDFLQEDLLLTTMRDIPPFYDFSITSMTRFSAGKVFSCGAGISFDNWITTIIPENLVTHSYSQNGFLNGPGDTGYYPTAGIKLLGQIMVDPKRFFKYSSFLGDKDLQLYAEAAVLGLQDYPASNKFDSLNKSNTFGYDDIAKRIPVMMGIDLPTHQFLSYCIVPALLAYGLEPLENQKLAQAIGYGLPGIALGIGSWAMDKFFNTNTRLDLIALETEWYGCPYQDNYSKLISVGLPVPLPRSVYPGFTDTSGNVNDDNWKWSLYMKKRFYKNGEFIMQVARDHLRTDMQIKRYNDFGATLVRKNAWYWMAKMKFYF